MISNLIKQKLTLWNRSKAKNVKNPLKYLGNKSKCRDPFVHRLRNPITAPEVKKYSEMKIPDMTF